MYFEQPCFEHFSLKINIIQRLWTLSFKRLKHNIIEKQTWNLLANKVALKTCLFKFYAKPIIFHRTLKIGKKCNNNKFLKFILHSAGSFEAALFGRISKRNVGFRHGATSLNSTFFGFHPTSLCLGWFNLKNDKE